MNWFKTASREDTLIKISWDFKNQEVEKIEMGDAMRYTMDSHDINIALNKTSNNIVVSLTMGSAYVGTYILDSFWSYELNEESKAKNLYKKLGQTIRPLVRDFINNKMPTSLLCPYIKEATFNMDRENVVRTNIPSINYSYDIAPEKDWRSTIYGNRYPKYEEPSFKQYLNNSIYSNDNPNKPAGKFAL